MASIDNSSQASASNSALRLQDFLGEWRDSMGHQVRVAWARPGNRAGELDVQLLRPRSDSRDPIRLNVKALGQGQFQCGHFELKLDDSSADKIVWSNKRANGKLSVWERGAPSGRARSRSRSPMQRRQRCGCVLTAKIALRCVDHLPLLPPRSVLQDIQTPGAWAPPTLAAEVTDKTCVAAESGEAPQADVQEGNEKSLESKPPQVAKELSEVDRLAEAYDESLADYGEIPDDVAPVDYPDPEELCNTLDDARAKVLAKHEAKENVLEQVKEQMIGKLLQVQRSTSTRKDASRDPRLRRSVVAPTGGA